MNNKQLNDLLYSSMEHQRFYMLQTDLLGNTLKEVSNITNDKLVCSVVRNALERHELDKTIHAKLIFNK